jgi:hypothetical protein
LRYSFAGSGGRRLLGSRLRSLSVRRAICVAALSTLIALLTFPGTAGAAAEDDSNCLTKPATVPAAYDDCTTLDEKSGSTDLPNGPPLEGEVWWGRTSGNELDLRIFARNNMNGDEAIQVCVRTSSGYTTQKCAGGTGTLPPGGPNPKPSDRIYVGDDSDTFHQALIDLDNPTSNPGGSSYSLGAVPPGTTVFWQAHVNQDDEAEEEQRSTFAAGSSGGAPEAKTQPEITTDPDPDEGEVEDTLNDSATLTGGDDPTGTITFNLFRPGDTDCEGPPAHSEDVTVDNGNDTYSTATGFAADEPGTWQWVATYSGDEDNESATHECGDEPVIVSKKSPSISTDPDPDRAEVGDTLNDTATLSGGTSDIGGTITFDLFGPDDPNCDGTPVHSEDVDVDNGNDDYSTSQGFVADAAGTWQWVASYSGDDNNEADSDSCGDEPVTIDKKGPAISTTPDPDEPEVEDELNDTATISGGSDDIGGTITFDLFGPDDPNCDGTPVHSEDVDVDNGNGDYSTATGFIADAPGTWNWVASYSGDDNNDPDSDECGDEPVEVSKKAPTIDTTPSPASAAVGDTIHDIATISGATSSAGGTITFDLFGPDDPTCSGDPRHSEDVSIDGDGNYATVDGFEPDEEGTWNWVASYSGDDNNEEDAGACGDEPVVVAAASVEEKNDPSISTQPDPASGEIGTVLNDTATLSEATEDATGNITFRLFAPEDPDCTGDPEFTETVEVDGNGTYSTDSGYEADRAGTWRWMATYSGDAANNPASSGCDEEQVAISDPAQPADPAPVQVGGVQFAQATTLPKTGVGVLPPLALGLNLLCFGFWLRRFGSRHFRR